MKGFNKCPHCGYKTYLNGVCGSCGYGATNNPILPKMNKRALADEQIRQRIDKIKELRAQELPKNVIAKRLYLHRDTLREFWKKYLPELK